MKRLWILFFTFLIGCSENEQLDYVFVDINEPSQSLIPGENYRLMAEVTTPNTLRAITIMVGNSERVININSKRTYTVDTTFRIDPTKSIEVVKVKAEDTRGNFEAKVTLNFLSYTLPSLCLKSNNIPIIVATPLTTPSNESMYINGSFNNNLFGDEDYRLITIPGTMNCACVSIPVTDDVVAQFNRGTETSINQSFTCRTVYFGFWSGDTKPVGILLEKWKDIDCN